MLSVAGALAPIVAGVVILLVFFTGDSVGASAIRWYVDLPENGSLEGLAIIFAWAFVFGSLSVLLFPLRVVALTYLTRSRIAFYDDHITATTLTGSTKVIPYSRLNVKGGIDSMGNPEFVLSEKSSGVYGPFWTLHDGRVADLSKSLRAFLREKTSASRGKHKTDGE